MSEATSKSAPATAVATEAPRPAKRTRRRAAPQPAPEAAAPAPAPAPPVFAAIGRALRLLEDGIRLADWGLVGQAYAMLSGEPPPRPARIDPLLLLRDIGQTIGQYMAGHAAAPPAEPEAPEATEAPEMSEAGLSEAGLSDDATLAEESRRLSRERPARSGAGRGARTEYRPVDATCTRCGKTRPTNPALIPPRVAADDQATAFICNRCVVGGGR